MDKRFTPIAKSGFWMLSNWEKTTLNDSIVNIIEIFLHQKKVPQTLLEIYEFVKSHRNVSKNSIHVYVYTNPKFVHFGNSRYGLSNWNTPKYKQQRKPQIKNKIDVSLIITALKEVFNQNIRIRIADLIVKVNKLTNMNPLSIRNIISKSKELKTIEIKNKSPLVECTNIEFLSLLEKSDYVDKRTVIQNNILKIMTYDKIEKKDLFKQIEKKVNCKKPTFYRYLSEMDNIKQYKEGNKYYCELKHKNDSKQTISFLDYSKVNKCTDNDIKESILKATKKLNIDDIDVGLFEFGKIFESSIHRYLLLCKSNNLFSVTQKDLNKLVDMIKCIEKNNSFIKISIKPHLLNTLREDRNMRAHGGIPSLEERKKILALSPYIVETYIEYIVKFTRLYHGLDS